MQLGMLCKDRNVSQSIFKFTHAFVDTFIYNVWYLGSKEIFCVWSQKTHTFSSTTMIHDTRLYAL